MFSPKTLISYDEKTKKLKCHGDVFKDLSSSITTEREGYGKLPVAIVSVVGDPKTGKSFLLNIFLRYLRSYTGQHEQFAHPEDPLEGFEWKHGIDRVTKGIVVWPEPFIVRRKDGQRIAVILMDTQGLNDDETSEEVNKQLFGLTTLLSSVQIYNSKHQIKSNNIVDLAKLCKFGESIYKRTGRQSKASGELVFLIRDWKNSHEFPFGLEEKMVKQRDHFSQYWDTLTNCYNSINRCFVMPSPGECSSSPEYQGQFDPLKVVFVIDVMEFTRVLLSPEIIQTKSWIGDELSLSEYTNFFEQVASHLEEYQGIQIDRLLDNFEEVQSMDALESAIELYMKMVFTKLNNRNFRSIDFVLENCENQARDHFNERAVLAGAINFRNFKRLTNFFGDFKAEYKASNKDKEKERWKHAFSVGGNLALEIGLRLIFNRFKKVGLALDLLKLFVIRS